MNYFVLIYHLVDDYLLLRTAHREEHLHLSTEANRHGDLLLAGAFSNPADRALLIFRVKDKAIIEEFIRNDPYVVNGLVTRWEIRPWTVVIGK
ncbi:MAG: YciI-like protein [Bacteroidota bacterium]